MADQFSTSSSFEPNLAASSSQALATGVPNLEIITPSSELSTTLQNRLVFSTFREQGRTENLTLKNTGTEALTITGLTFGDSQEKENAVRPADHERGDDFKYTGTLPTIAPGRTIDIPIRFLPQRVAIRSSANTTYTFNGENYASLTINSNDPDQPTTTVDLAGLNADLVTGKYEPAVAEIFRTFGWGINVGSEAQQLGGDKTLLGDEVYSPYWVRADTSQPVELFPIAVYSSPDTIPHDSVAYQLKGSSREFSLYRLPGGEDRGGGENQKLLPKILINGQGVAPTSESVDFSPNGPFALNRGGGLTDDSKNGEFKTHEWRIYTLRDKNGVIVPNNWVAASDTGLNPNKNFDYNDNVYLLKNAKPESPELNPSVGGLVPGSPDLIFNFNKTYQGSLTDKDGQSIGFTDVQLNKNDGYTPTTSYQRSQLDINPTESTLKVKSAAGINSSDNNLINGLRTIFDGRAGKAKISTKLLGSLDYLNAGFEQAGLMFGYDQNNYVKLVATNTNGSVGVEFLFENKGVLDRLGQVVPLANPSNLQSLELKLFTNPQEGTIRAGYEAIDTAGNSTIVDLPSFVSLKGKGSEYGHFFAAQSKAGILTSHKGGSPFTATFDNFAIQSNETKAARNTLYRLDVGDNASFPPPAGWSSDAPYLTPANAISETGANSPAAIANTDNPGIYRTYRAKLPQGTPLENRILSYDLPVTSPGTYDVRLHFAEIYFGVPGGGPASSGVGSRIFDIIVEGKNLLQNFDITAAAGDSLTAVVVPLEDIKVTDGNLEIDLRADVDFGAISGIEVLQKVRSV